MSGTIISMYYPHVMGEKTEFYNLKLQLSDNESYKNADF